MPERPQSPPPEKMIRQLSVPDFSLGYFTELVSRESTRFQQNFPIKRGVLYNSTVGADQKIVDQFAGDLFFLRETVPLDGTIRGMEGDQWVKWHWSSDPSSENTYNAKVEYFLENVSYPVFTRETTIRRDTYETTPTVAYGSALTSLLYIKVTAGGTGYASTDTVNIAGGLGAAATLVVSATGVITNIIVTDEGSGYDSDSLPAITFTTSTGSGATAVAIVQPKTAVLIHQEKQELPPDDPYSHEYIKLIRVYRAITGPTLTGQDYDPQYDFAFPYTLQETAAGHNVGNNRVEITPIDTVRQKERTVDPGIATAVFGGYLLTIPSTVSLQLPDVLQSISAVMETNSGEGVYTETGSGFAFSPGGWSLNIPGRGQASAAILPDLVVTIKQSWAHNIPSTRYIFFLQIPVTTTDVTNRLTALVGATVSAWPKFSPISHTVLCIGQRLSLQVNTSAQEQNSLSGTAGEGYSESSGSGYSKEVGLSIKAIRIPPTIHGTITISGTTSDTITATATASSTTGLISADESQSGDVTGYITPTSLSATSNDASIPTSGKRIVNVEGQPYRYGYAVMHAEVVDFSDVG